MGVRLTSEKDKQMWGFRKKKTRVAAEVILQQMRQQVAERGRDEGGDQVRKNDWAPVLAESGTRLRDIREECGEPVWRETVRVRLACTAGKQAVKIERLQKENDGMGALMKRILEENDAMGAEMKRLQEENETLREISLVKMTTMVVKDLQDNELSAPLCCPITHELFKYPVVSRFGYSYEREAIEKWLLQKSSCPVTNQYMTIAYLAHNRALADVVETVRTQQL